MRLDQRAEAGSARVAIFLMVGGFLAGLLVLYTLRARPPHLPADADHVQAIDPERCLSCHGPGQKRPRRPSHPLNDQCFSCHERG